MDIQSYLIRIFKGSFFTKKEQIDMAEEIESHLISSKERYVHEGYTEEEAVQRALQSFGEPNIIRNQLTKELFGLSSRTIIYFVYVGAILFLCSLIGGLILNSFKVHNRIIELFPILLMTFTALSCSLLFTRKNSDRWCLLSIPLLFGIGYLQAYFDLFSNIALRSIDSFQLFENLFFSGALDYDGRSSFIFLGGVALSMQAVLIYAISKNVYISILPFIFSILYTLSHIIIFSLYYLFFEDSFISHVTLSFQAFFLGNTQRIADIAFKLFLSIVIYLFLRLIKKRETKQAIKAV